MRLRWCWITPAFGPRRSKGRDLPVHKRNDLLHFDSFPTRPHERPSHPALFHQHQSVHPARVEHDRRLFHAGRAVRATEAGLPGIAAKGSAREPSAGAEFQEGARPQGGGPFSLRPVHAPISTIILKKQRLPAKTVPRCGWSSSRAGHGYVIPTPVPHAVLSGQYALETDFHHPFDFPGHARQSPRRVLENLAGKRLTR